MSLPVYLGICVLIFGLRQAHYISEKDVFLIVTGVAYPPNATGLHIWQTIESIGESRINESSLNHTGWSIVWHYSALICGAISSLVVLLLYMWSKWTAGSVPLFLF